MDVDEAEHHALALRQRRHGGAEALQALAGEQGPLGVVLPDRGGDRLADLGLLLLAAARGGVDGDDVGAIVNLETQRPRPDL